MALLTCFGVCTKKCIKRTSMSEIIQTMDHRRVFVDTLNELGKSDPNIVLITCDVGFNYLTGKETFKVLNLGVTEVSSSIIASAMALSKLKIYFYTMIPFATFRIHECIRNAICLHKSNVTIAGVLGGPSYKMLGLSHNLLHPMEDVNMMQEMPGMQIYLPNTNDDLKNMVIDAYSHNKPSYIKL